jgi:hypothetical protein
VGRAFSEGTFFGPEYVFAGKSEVIGKVAADLHR